MRRRSLVFDKSLQKRSSQNFLLICMVLDDHDATWGKVEFSIAVIQSSICLACLIFTIFIQCRIHERSISRMIPCCTFTGVLSFLFSGISLALYYWSFIYFDYIYFESGFEVFCWAIGQFCSYLVFFLRLMDSFDGSVYRVPRRACIGLVSLIILYETAWIIQFVGGVFLFWPHQSLTRICLFILILVLDIVITVVMCYMFIFRLFAVMRGQALSVHDRHVQMEELYRSLNVDGTNYRLLNLSVKISTLSIISLLSSLIFVVLNTIIYYTNWRKPTAITFWTVHNLEVKNIWLSIDTVISCICLTLFLSSRLYQVLCCCCVSLGNRCMRNALLRRNDADAFSDHFRSHTSLGISNGPSNCDKVINESISMQSDAERLNKPSPLKLVL